MNERDVFQAAIAIPDDDARRAYLDSACTGNDALRERVGVLLKAHEHAVRFLEQPVFPALAAADEPGATTAGRTLAADDDDDALDFLEPSDKPGSLGRLAHYEVLEVLGRGAFGTVVKAFDETLHRLVAIKVMDHELACTSPPRKRFLREARAAAAVRHENVVSIYAVDERPVPYLVMEYIAGRTLQQELDRSGPMDAAEVARIGYQIAAGLAAAHRQGLIHRDIKPGNILLEDGIERVKITDFGLARTVDDASVTQSGLIAGTPAYMAPEQALGASIDQRADLFSLGSVLYVMCTGRPPFRAPTSLAVLRRVAEDAPRPIHEIIPDVPDWLCALIERLHAKDPAVRFATAEEVARLLDGNLADPASLVARPRAVARKPETVDSELMTAGGRSGVRPRALSGCLVALTALIAGIVLFALIGLLVPMYMRTARSERGAAPRAADFANASRSAPGVKGEPPPEASLAVPPDTSLEPADSSSPPTEPSLPVPPGTSLEPWGQFLDPRGGSQASLDPDWLSIIVPGDVPRDLNPSPGFSLDAPRFAQRVHTDFIAQVTVLPFDRPGPHTTYTNGADSYHGAGLFVWADTRNLLRFELAKQATSEGGRPFTHLELFEDGRKTDEELRWTDEAPTYLQIERRGDRLVLRTSSDGRTWADYKTCPVPGNAPTVLVGVAAINSEAKPFAARFKGWSLQRAGLAAPVEGQPE